MDVKEFFSEPWFWDKHYEVFSEEELSQIEVLSEEETHTIWYEYCDNICYTDTRGVRVPVRLFCDKWYEFCFLAIYDDILLDLGENALLYYETDHLYILEKRTSKGEENVTVS